MHLSSLVLTELEQGRKKDKYKTHALFNALNQRCFITAIHSFKVARCVKTITKALGIYPIQEFFYAALLHDIGKLGISDCLLKSPVKYNEYHFEIMKKHVQIGFTLLSDLNMSELIKDGAKYHHERWDGDGYTGIKGESIPLVARIISLADTFEALTGKRPYRKPVYVDEAIAIMDSTEGQFDPVLLKLFVSLKPELKKLTLGSI